MRHAPARRRGRGLPLASTTYWFQSKEHLLTAALQRAADRDVERLRAFLDETPEHAADPLGLAVGAILGPSGDSAERAAVRRRRHSDLHQPWLAARDLRAGARSRAPSGAARRDHALDRRVPGGTPTAARGGGLAGPAVRCGAPARSRRRPAGRAARIRRRLGPRPSPAAARGRPGESMTALRTREPRYGRPVLELQRRTVVLIRVLLGFESVLYSALTPVLPHYAHAFGASKPAIGVLAASYPAGMIPGSLLGGWIATRTGVRRTTVVGLLLFTGSIVAFGFGADIVVLDGLRFVAGDRVRLHLGRWPGVGDRDLAPRTPRRDDRIGARGGDLRHADRPTARHGGGGRRDRSRIRMRRRRVARADGVDAPVPGASSCRARRGNAAACARARTQDRVRLLGDPARGVRDRGNRHPASAAAVAVRRFGRGDRRDVRGRVAAEPAGQPRGRTPRRSARGHAAAERRAWRDGGCARRCCRYRNRRLGWRR